MKNILIDLYRIKQLYSGLGQFSLNFALELEKRPPKELDISFLVPHTKFPASLNSKLFEPSVIHRFLPFINHPYFIWHSLHQLPSFFPPQKSIWILTIHDLNFIIEKAGKKQEKYRRRLQANVTRADYLTAISEFSKSEIEKHLDIGNKKIRVIHNGVAFDSNISLTKPNFISNEKFFFSIGVFFRKKNFEVLLPLIKQFPDIKLVIAGENETSYGAEIKSEINRLDIENQVILPGKINEHDKHWLYSNCEAFLFPSLAEGFGLPVIEAMYGGKPVFLSTSTSLPEIGGKQAFYFEGFDPENMAGLIKSSLESIKNPESFAEESKTYASRFNWHNCISQYINLYTEIYQSHC